MPEYAKMKNADLEALLKTRGLPTGGKKADMVDRLTKDDEKSTHAPPSGTSKPAVLHPEDEIDWDDDAEDVPAEPAKPATAAVVDAPASAPIAKTTTIEGQVSNPQAVPDQATTIDPLKADDPSVKASAEAKTEAEGEAKADEKQEPPPDYTRGLAASNLEAEIEKRKARAKKFGLKVEEDEGLKKLERAKKFGETGPPKGLDEALSDRTRKRGRDGEDNEDGLNKRRGGERRGRGNRGGDRGGDRRGERRGDRAGDRDGDRRRDNRDGWDNRGRGGSRRDDRRDDRNGGSAWTMSAEDKAKAEARKNKWATPAAST